VSILLQVSDTHFGTERAEVVDALASLSLQLKPDLMVMSGDITQRARRAQFDAARSFVDRLDLPTVVVPGNHDIPLFALWARWLWPYAGHRRVFGVELEPMHTLPDLLVVCVNTTRPGRHKHGEVSAEQVERVARRLDAASSAQLRVVVVHQPVAVEDADDVTNLLRGRKAALMRWAEAGADIVMGGHIHLPYVMPLKGLPRPMWAVQAGTAVSSRVRGGVPNSVNVLRCGDDAPDGVCVVEQWDHVAKRQAFQCVAVTKLRPGVPSG
jgi:3',5'-cyclic AMP phosphodiesterase CpdA